MPEIAIPALSRRAVLGGLCAVVAEQHPAAADAPYPNKFVSIVVPFAPGGFNDFVARIIQPKFAELLGQQVIIINRAGAAGNIGMTDVAHAEPDGYTLLLASVGNITINPSVYGKLLRISTVKDLAPITLLADAPDVLIASPSFPPNTVKEMVEYVRARPGKINFASPGSGSLNRLEMELFREAAGLDMVHVAYKGGAGEAVAAIMGAEVPVMFTTMASAASQVQGKSLKALAVTSAKRAVNLPDVPTMVESGYPDLVASSWQSMLTTAGTPAPVRAKLFNTLKIVMADPDVGRRLLNGGAVVRTSDSPDEFAGFIAAELKRWSAVVQATGARAD
jgi:tripartite-type tricarboxylate transporter receptor subunit TctC